MQRSPLALAVVLLLMSGIARPAAAENPVREPKKLAVTILNNGFQPAAGKIDEEILTLLRAERASDRGLVDLLKLEQCGAPLTDECLDRAVTSNRTAIAAELSARNTDAWVVIARMGAAPYHAYIWTFTSDDRGGAVWMSSRHPAVAFQPKMWLGVASRAGLCDAEEEGGPCRAR